MLPLATALIPVIGGILDKIVPDPNAAAQAKLALMQLAQTGELTRMTAAADVIKAEATSQFRLTSQWRPILMLTFTFIVANNYIFSPYLQAMFGWHVSLELPPEMWDLIKIGVGGYITGRSLEKAVGKYSDSKQPQQGTSAASNPSAFMTNGG